MRIKDIGRLLLKDFKVEFRNAYSTGSVLLYVITATYIIYKSFQQVSLQAWNVLFWIIFLFAALNALVRSFSNENHEQYLYMYSLAHPVAIIIAKIIFNTVLLSIVSCLLILTMSLFIYNPIQEVVSFILAILLGAFGVSTCFTFVASVATAGDNNSTIMAILALPLVIPILLLLLKISAHSLGILTETDLIQDFILLSGIDLILFGLAILLFPVTWRS